MITEINSIKYNKFLVIKSISVNNEYRWNRIQEI
jgi:hypothetical protein